MAQLEIFREHPLLMAGTLDLCFWHAGWRFISRWAWRGIAAHHRELIFWVMPRGLITVVLAFEIAQQRGTGMAFVPGLAFAVILITNAMLVLASFRAGKSAPASLNRRCRTRRRFACDSSSAQPGTRRRFVLNAVMLMMLAVGGIVLWYGDHSDQVRPTGVVQWIKTHLHRAQ